MIPLKTFCDKNDNVYAVVETPKGSRNKCNYNEEGGFFELSKVLPAGCTFPYDFGFVPGTKCDDGDPIDVIVFSDAPGVTGMVVQCRVVGIIEAEQKERGKKKERNDRLLAVALESRDHSQIKDYKDINQNLLNELLGFFKYYNAMYDKKFKVLSIKNSAAAIKAIRKSMERK